MGIISDVLTGKKGPVLTTSEESTVLEAIQQMVAHNVGSIVVTDAARNVVGIFTERDYLRRIVLQQRRSATTRVCDVMSDDLVFADPEQSVEEVMEIMTNHRIRHIPVLKSGQMVGIVSQGDLMKYISSQKSSEVKFLTDYITGQYPGEMGTGL